MKPDRERLLRSKLRDDNFSKLQTLGNEPLCEFIAEAVELCDPADVFVCTDTDADIEFIRRQAIQVGEETPLSIPGHTVHFDGINDQGRDREVTRYLVPGNQTLAKALNQIERDAGLTEVRGLLAGAMRGRTMIVRFVCLGPTGSVFSVPCVQCTDSFYVAHSEELLYRRGYEQFRDGMKGDGFFRFIHSSGKVDDKMVSVEADKKRIYIDYTRETIYSVNTQYAGNSVGMKKLALRLTIRKADQEGWLAEHMFLMGVRGPGGRKTYFAGAFPSACGKTSTAMLPGETIMGDDIAYLRNINGEGRAVNTENGIFGIIQSVNPVDDPVIHKVLTTPGEVVFSNVLAKDGRPYWLDMGVEVPTRGVNFSGEWFRGKKDEKGVEIPPAHKNARYAVALHALENVDPELENPQGVVVGGIIYGGRDAEAGLPVQQGFDYEHGILAYGASLETETTFAIIGAEGKREINIMSIQDFVSIPLGKYVRNNLEFMKRLRVPPEVFGVNYFLRDKQGKFVTGMRDKAVWVKWMELRVHGDVEGLHSPLGWIPKYEDLRALFGQVLNKPYEREDYVRQFTVRVVENLAKIARVETFFQTQVADPPDELFHVLGQQRERLELARKQVGDYVSPFDLHKTGA